MASSPDAVQDRGARNRAGSEGGSDIPSVKVDSDGSQGSLGPELGSDGGLGALIPNVSRTEELRVLYEQCDAIKRRIGAARNEGRASRAARELKRDEEWQREARQVSGIGSRPCTVYASDLAVGSHGRGCSCGYRVLACSMYHMAFVLN